MRRLGALRRLAAAASLLIVYASGALAQQSVASATIAGTVFDPSGAIVQGAAVTLQNLDTNQSVDVRSDDRGRYRLLYVAAGRHLLSAAGQGFSPVQVTLTVNVGQQLDVPLKLAAPTTTESVNVSAPAPLVEAARTEAADTIKPQEIDSLPLNGRNYLDLALLVPNVSRTNTRANDRFAETSAVPGTGISVAGQRNLGNSFIVDGLSANDDAADLAGTYYAEDVIREFQVITSGGTAEFGRASAGTINIVTQSGTNDLRGRAYGFFRNDALDARNALATRKDPLSQEQFGVTLGGPVAKDRTFWFGNVERTNQDKTGIVTISPGSVAAINTVLDRVGYRGPRLGTGAFPTGYSATNVFGRLDSLIPGRSRLEARYNLYDVASPNARGAGGLSDVSRGTRLDDNDQTSAVSLLSTLSPAMFNEARGQFTRSRLSAPVNDPVGPAVSISGVAMWGTSTSAPTARDLDVWQFADTLTWQNGSHLVKTGVDLLYNRVDIAFPGAIEGSYSFQSLPAFERGAYQQYQQAFGIPSLLQRNPNAGVFVQDEWRASSAITVNAGLRYDVQWLPSPIALDANNVSPRAGVAWAAPDGRTVVRASGGVYFDRIPLRATSNALQRDGVQYKVAVVSPGQPGAPEFPEVMTGFPSGLLTAITSIDPEIQSGRSEQLSLQFERAISGAASVTAGYSYLRGHNIIMSRNINVPTLTAAQAAASGVPNLGRPDPSFGNISQYQSAGDSWFQGLTLSLNARTGTWGTSRISYTLSRALDDAGNAFFSTPQDNGDVLADKGPSDNDQRHRLVISGTLGASRSNAGGWRAFHGFELGYVFSFATGTPFNVQTGNDRNGDTNVNDRPAGVGRNSGRLPSASSLDVRLSRVFPLHDGHRIEAMIEAFNVLNHVNVLNVNNTFGTGMAPLPTFGQPTLAGDPRQIQLGVRWSF